MNIEEMVDKITQKSELLGYNEAVGDCILVIINYLKRFEHHSDYRVIISMIGDDIAALKKTGE